LKTMYSFQKQGVQQPSIAPHGHRGHPNPCGCGGGGGSQNPVYYTPGQNGIPFAGPMGNGGVVLVTPQNGQVQQALAGGCAPQAAPVFMQQPVYMQTPGPAAPGCAPSSSGTIPCGPVPFGREAGVVDAQSCFVSPTAPPMSICVQSCLPVVLVDCVTKKIFTVNGFNGGIEAFDPLTCTFFDVETTAAGCGPRSVTTLYAICDPSKPQVAGQPQNVYFVACLPNATIVRWNASTTPSLRKFIQDACTPLANCGDMYPVLWDEQNDKFVVMFPPTAEQLQVDVTGQFCPG
jgi:hypothetical protein